MTAPRVVPGPIAVFEGRGWHRWAAQPWIVITVGIGASVVTHGLAAYLPWLGSLTTSGALIGVALVLNGLFVALGIALHFWARARVGRAELLADRLVVLHEGQLLHVVLGEVVVFDDRSADFVRLVLERAEWVRARLTLTVPTPDDAARATLVAALAAAGVPRDDGQPLPSEREPQYLGPALLVVHANRHRLIDLVWLLSLPLLLGTWAGANRLGPAVLAGSLFIAAPIAAWAWTRHRTGKVWFLDQRIVVNPMHLSSPPGWRCVLAWDDVVGWRASSRAYLRLVLRPGLLRDTHGEPAIPTPTPDTRASVEALLAARGVPRLS